MAKKSKTIQFNVPDPCSENWNNMHSLPGGRFCDNCEKTVVDFTEMTDNELVRFFQKNNQKLCGRFRSDQLNKEIEFPRVPTPFQKLKSVAAIAAGLLAWNSTSAQTPLPVENISIVDKTKSLKGIKLNEQKINTTFSRNKIKGIVKDEKGETLIGVNILLEKNRGTTTDIEGKFELEIPSDWESFDVTFSYLGYESQVIEFELQEIIGGKLAEVKMEKTSQKMLPTELTLVKIEQSKVLTDRLMYLTGRVGPIFHIENENETKSEIKSEIKSETKNETKSETKSETNVEEIKLPISRIYPNPFVDFVNVLLYLEKDQPYLFHLYNVNGQLIWAKTYDLAKGKQELRLDFSEVSMTKGNYFLRITDGNREMQTKKIIKVNTKGEKPQVLPVQQ